jgi:hypothetical protein
MMYLNAICLLLIFHSTLHLTFPNYSRCSPSASCSLAGPAPSHAPSTPPMAAQRVPIDAMPICRFTQSEIALFNAVKLLDGIPYCTDCRNRVYQHAFGASGHAGVVNVPAVDDLVLVRIALEAAQKTAKQFLPGSIIKFPLSVSYIPVIYLVY